MSHELQKESMDTENPGRNEGSSPFRPKENGIHLYPVSVNDSGEGLVLPEDCLIQGINGFGRSGKESLCQDSIWTDTYILPAFFARLGREEVLQLGSH